MKEATICLSIPALHPAGGMYVEIPATSENMAMIRLHDMDMCIAHALGVRLDDYLAWKSAGGDVYCSGKTRRGMRCRNIVTGGSMLELRHWMKMSGSCCRVHEE